MRKENYFRNRRVRAQEHVSDDLLLLAGDGELSEADALAVREHLRACWSCRTRSEAIARTIQGIVEHDRVMALLEADTAGGSARMFRARLDRLAEELGRPSWVRRCVFALRRRPARWALRWAVACAMGAALVWQMPWLWKKDLPAVSAAELLQRAVASELPHAPGIHHPVAVQKLRIRVNGHAVLRTVYRDGTAFADARPAMEDTAEARGVRSAFDRTSFHWDDALSAAAYQAWWKRSNRKQDSLTKPGEDLLRLDTATWNGPVSRASFTVRLPDFHPIAEALVLPDNTEIEIAEISYGVIDFASLSPKIFGGHEVTAPIPAKLRLIVPDAAQLATAELKILLALHSIGADQGEQITVQPTPAHRMKVEGVTESKERRDQIAAAVAGIDFVEFQVRSAQLANSPSEEAAMPAPDQVIVATSNPPRLNQQLEQRFPNANQRAEFINRTVTLCETLTSRSWALKRLADRYTPQHAALLTTEEQQQLQQLVQEQGVALHEAAASLQQQAAPWMDLSAADTTAEHDAEPAVASDRTDDWRRRVNRMHRSAEAAAETALKLFAMPSQEEESTAEMQIRLRDSLMRLQTDLTFLNLEVHQHL